MFSRFLPILALATGLLPASASAAPAVPPPPAIPATIVSDPANDPVWRALFATLGTPKSRVSQFEERRYFPFRAEPVVLNGEIRLSPERGLSLHYFGSREQTVIVDRAGVLMRDGRGRQRAAPNDSRAQAATSGLFEVLRFELPSLVKDFEVHAGGTPAGWTLGFVPRDPKLAELIGAVVVQGAQARVQQIDLLRSDKQRIEIRIKSTLEDVIFPEDVVKRFFR